MFNDISSLETGLGNNIGGVCSFKFVPREWLSGPFAIDQVTGAVTALPTLLPGKAWLTATCMERSMEYVEKPRNEKGGNYVDCALTGIAYKQELERHLIIATLHYHELVVIYTDSNGIKRIIGDYYKGMSFAADNTTGKDPKDSSLYAIHLVHQRPEAAPIYIGPY